MKSHWHTRRKEVHKVPRCEGFMSETKNRGLGKCHPFIWQAMPWEQEQMGQRSWDRLDKTKMTGHPFSDIHAAF